MEGGHLKRWPLNRGSAVPLKMGKHSDFHLSFFQIVVAWWEFTVVNRLIKKFKSLYFRVHNLICVPMSVYGLVKSWNSPQFPTQYCNGQSALFVQKLNILTSGMHMIIQYGITKASYTNFFRFHLKHYEFWGITQKVFLVKQVQGRERGESVRQGISNPLKNPRKRGDFNLKQALWKFEFFSGKYVTFHAKT